MTLPNPERSQKIVCLCTQMEGGGAQGAAVRMARYLREKGYAAEVWFLYQKRPTYIDEPNTYTFLAHPFESIAQRIKTIYRLFAKLKNEKPQVVYAFGRTIAPLGMTLALLAGIKPRVATQRNQPASIPKGLRFADLLCGMFGVYTDNICVSHDVFSAFKHYPACYKKKLRVVENGIEPLMPTKNRHTTRELLGLPTDAPLIVSVGRLAQQKNHAFLISLMKELPEPIHLAIAGDGELRDTLLNQVMDENLGDRVHLLGEISSQNIANFIAAGDVFAFPSRHEAFGFAVVEALSIGQTVITSDISVLKDIIKDNGYCLPLAQPQLWVQTLQNILLGTEHNKQEFAEKARTRAQYFSLERMMQGYLNPLTH